MSCHRRFFLYVVALVEACASGGQIASAVTLDIRVNASTDDATQYPGSNMRLTDSTMKFENQSWMGLRFNNVTIPDNAYITEAYMTFWSSSSASVTRNQQFMGRTWTALRLSPHPPMTFRAEPAPVLPSVGRYQPGRRIRTTTPLRSRPSFKRS